MVCVHTSMAVATGFIAAYLTGGGAAWFFIKAAVRAGAKVGVATTIGVAGRHKGIAAIQKAISESSIAVINRVASGAGAAIAGAIAEIIIAFPWASITAGLMAPGVDILA